MKNCIFIFFLFLMFSCQLQETDTPKEISPISEYHWVKSTISPTTPIFFSLYTQDENSNLYGYGYQNDVAIFKLDGNNWVRFQEIEEQGVIYSNGSSFTSYNHSFYMASGRKLYQVENGIMKEIFSTPSGMIYDIQSFKGKMLIAGENLTLNEETYSIINFDGSQFQPVSKLEILGRGLALENDILFAGFPGFTYNGENVTLNNVYGYIAGADHMSNVYVIDNELNNYTVVQNSNNTAVQVGTQITLTKDQDLGGIYSIDNTFVLLGSNVTSNHNITFVLNNNVWEKVETIEPITFKNILKYNGRIMGCTINGELLELVKK